MRVLGQEDLITYVNKYNLHIPKEVRRAMKDEKFPKKSWDSFICERNRHLVSEDAIDLLDKMLRYDKNDRIRPKDALEHKYFDPIRDFVAK